MSIEINRVFEPDPTGMSATYCAKLMELAAKDKRIMALDSDLVSSSGMKPFFNAYPDRAINCGVQEANMVGIAAGLSATGKVPFAHSFGTFASRRCLDQIFMSASYAKLNVRITGTDPGVTAAYNGGTHMPFEDMACLRGIPDITLVEPTDCVMLGNLLEQLADLYGVFYIRLLRKNPYSIYAPGSTFEIGRGIELRDGTDVTLIGSGILVHESIKAAEMLKQEGISARVVDMFTWKPIDTQLVGKCAKETGAIVVSENHNTLGGLGSAVCEAVCRTFPAPVEQIGTQDRFGQVGTEAFLREEYHMTAQDIAAAARKAIARKK